MAGVYGFFEVIENTAGQVLMQDRQLLTMDEEAITARARELAPEVWQRYNSFVPH